MQYQLSAAFLALLTTVVALPVPTSDGIDSLVGLVNVPANLPVNLQSLNNNDKAARDLISIPVDALNNNCIGIANCNPLTVGDKHEDEEPKSKGYRDLTAGLVNAPVNLPVNVQSLNDRDLISIPVDALNNNCIGIANCNPVTVGDKHEEEEPKSKGYRDLSTGLVNAPVNLPVNVQSLNDRDLISVPVDLLNENCIGIANCNPVTVASKGKEY